MKKVDAERVRPRPSGILIVAAAAIAIIAIANLNVPYYALTPGPAENVITLIDIHGAKTKNVHGKLLLTTVSLHPIRLAESFRGWFDPSYRIVPHSEIVAPGESERDANQRTQQQMAQSQVYASAAALRYLGYHVNVTSNVRVLDFAAAAPASKTLHRGDVIVKVEGKSIKSSQDIRTAIRSHKVGDPITLQVIRESKTITVTTKTIGRPDNPSVPAIGVITEDVRIPNSRLPLAIDISSLGIGGPSAGLMFAVGIVDLLDSTDLARGRTIAGTGEIDTEGNVGQIGGVRQKVESARRAGADMFIVPQDELAQACPAAGHLQIVGVRTLKDAIDVLRHDAVARERACH